MEERFSVTQFFEDDSYESPRKHVPLQEAVDAFKHYTTNVTSRIGITKRVIITDGGDCIVAEWEFGKGLVFPLANQSNVQSDLPKKEFKR